MAGEFTMLLWTVLATALMAFPYVLERIATMGLFGAMGNPRDDAPEPAAWAMRAKKAHANAVENLVLFAPAALLVVLTQQNNAATATAAIVYFGARIVHYVVYTMGIPVIRTLAFFAGWGATVYILLRVAGMV